MIQNSSLTQRKRRFLLVLPLLTVPFLALLFWSLGGGTTTPSENKIRKGLNLGLPDARPDEGATDKLSLYQQAEKDSMELAGQRRLDPNWEVGSRTMDTGLLSERYASDDLPGSPVIQKNPAEQKIQQQLNSLERALSEPDLPDYEHATTTPPVPETDDVERLGQMMQRLQAQPDADPEMAQLDGMLEKILDIQNPARAQQKLREQSRKNKGQVFAAAPAAGEQNIRLLQPASYSSNGDTPFVYDLTNRFHALDAMEEQQPAKQAIPAVVHETQELTNGATIKLRLMVDIFVNGNRVPKGTLVFGTCNLEGERLQAEINTIRYRNALFPVALLIYDMDAIAGIQIPGAISRDVAKGNSDAALHGLEIGSMNPTLGAQAANAGVQIAKGIFSRKVKLIKITVKAGYPVLLADQNQRNEQ